MIKYRSAEYIGRKKKTFSDIDIFSNLNFDRFISYSYAGQTNKFVTFSNIRISWQIKYIILFQKAHKIV